MRSSANKVLSVFMSVVLVLGLWPGAAYAAGGGLRAVTVAEDSQGAITAGQVDTATDDGNDQAQVAEGGDQAQLADGNVGEQDDASAGEPKMSSIVQIVTQAVSDYSMTLPEGDIPALNIGDAADVALDGADTKVQWLAFTPEEDGYYAFASQKPSNDESYYGDPYGAVYERQSAESTQLDLLQSDDDANGDNNFRVMAPSLLQAGQTYYLACSSYSDDSAHYTVSVAQVDAYDIGGLEATYNSFAWNDSEDLLSGMCLSIYSLTEKDEEGYGRALTDGEDYEAVAWYERSGYDEETGEPTYTQVDGVPSTGGSYRVKVQGIGSYSGEREIDFNLYVAGDLDYYYASLAIPCVVYDGTEVTADELAITFTRYGTGEVEQFVLGEDYELTDWCAADGELLSTVTELGNYVVTVRGVGSCTNSTTLEFTVAAANDIAYATVECDKGDNFYYLPPMSLALTVTAPDGTVLREGEHYAAQLQKSSGDDAPYESVAAIDGPGSYRYHITALDGSGYQGECDHAFYVKRYDWGPHNTFAPVPGQANALLVGTPQTVQLTEANSHVQWLSFTPETDGKYTFSSALGSGGPYATLYRPLEEGDDQPDDPELAGLYFFASSDEEEGSSEASDFSLTATLSADTTYYLACGIYGNYDESYEVSVALFDPYDLAHASASCERLLAEGAVASIKALGVHVEDADYNILQSGKNYAVEGWYDADGTALDAAPAEVGDYFVRIAGVEPYYGTCDIAFSIKAANDLALVDISGVEGVYKYRGNEIQITPTVTALAEKTLVEGVDYTAMFEMYDEASESYEQVSAIDTVGEYRLVIEAGPTSDYVGVQYYAFAVEPYAWRFRDAYADVPDSASTLTAGEDAQIDGDDGSDNAQWFAFEPSESGKYVFASRGEGDPYAQLYGPIAGGSNADGYELESLGYDDDGGLDMNFKFTSGTLVAGETYYLACGFYGSGSSATVVAKPYDRLDISNCDQECATNRLWAGAPAALGAFGLVLSGEDADGKAVSLVEGADYELEGWYDEEGAALEAAPSEVGSYSVKLAGKGSYHGTAEFPFYINDPYDLSGSWWWLNVDDVYAGTAVDADSLGLSLRIDSDYDGVVPLPEFGTDYEIAGYYDCDYDDEALEEAPSQPGRYYVKVVGIGDYTGELTAYFRIMATGDLGNYEAGCNEWLWANGNPMTLARLGATLNPYNAPESKLAYGEDYVFEGWYDYDTDELLGDDAEAGPSEPGGYYAQFAGNETAGFTGRAEVSFTINDPNDINCYHLQMAGYVGLNDESLTVERLELVLDGNAEDGEYMCLTLGKDYIITGWKLGGGSYEGGYDWIEGEGGSGTELSEITEPGHYQISIAGVAPYVGTRAIDMEFVDASDLAYARIYGIEDEYYLDKLPELAPEVYDSAGKPLTVGEDCTVSIQKYDKSTASYATVEKIAEHGRYRVLVEPAGGLFAAYKGSASATFVVRPSEQGGDDPTPHDEGSIQFTPAKPYSLVANANGWVAADDGVEPFFCYSFAPAFNEGDTLVVNSADDTKTYIFTLNRIDDAIEGGIPLDDAFVNEADQDDVIESDEVTFETDQYATPWVEGSDNTAYVHYGSYTCPVNVTITPNNVASIRVQLADGAEKRTYTDGVDNPHGYFNTHARKGDSLIVTYKDGTHTTYRCLADNSINYEVVDGEDVELDTDYLSWESDQDSDGKWTAGNDYQIVVVYMGAECLIPASVVSGDAATIDDPVVLTAATSECTYDGMQHANDNFSVEGLPEGFTVKADVEGSLTDVGSIENVITGYAILDEQGVDQTSRFTNVTTVNGYIGVMPAEVQVTTQSAMRAYSGLPLTAEGQISGIVAGETVGFEVTGAQTEVGTSVNTYAITWADGANGYTAKQSNYQVVEDLGTLQVLKRPAPVLQVSAIGGPSEVVLSWSMAPDADATGYKVYRAPAGTELFELIGTVNGREASRTLTDHDVAEGAAYRYYITVFDAAGTESAPSDIAEAEPLSDSVNPTVIGFTPKTNSRVGGASVAITVKAEDNVGVTDIQVEVSSDGGNYWNPLEGTFDGEKATFAGELDTTGLTDGAIKVRATALDAKGNASTPFVVDYLVDNTGPEKVVNVTSESTTTVITLKWDDVSDNDLAYFVVERKVSGGTQADADAAQMAEETARVEAEAADWEAAQARQAADEASMRVETARQSYENAQMSGVDQETIAAYEDDLRVAEEEAARFAESAAHASEAAAQAQARYEEARIAAEQAHQVEYERVAEVSSTLGANITELAPGSEYTYRVVAYDQCGNRGTPSDDITASTLADTAAPVVTALSPNAGRVRGKLAVTAVVQDDASVASVQFQTSENAVVWTDAAKVVTAGKRCEAKTTIDTDALDEGNLFVRAIGTDAAGNVGDDSQEAPFVQYVVDRTPPAVPQGVEASATSGAVHITWEQGTEDDLAGYSVFRVLGPHQTTCIASGLKTLDYWDRAVQPEDVCNYEVRAVDEAGNYSDPSETVRATVPNDQEKPEILSYAPAPGTLVGPQNASLSVLVGDNLALGSVHATCKVDGGEAVDVISRDDLSGTSQLVTGVLPIEQAQDGSTLTITVNCADAAGNLAQPITYALEVDKTAPSIANLVAEGEDDAIALTWKGGGEADLAGYRIYRAVEGGEYEIAGSQAPVDGTDYKYVDETAERLTSYTYKVEAVDAVGNTAAIESSAVQRTAGPQVTAALTCDIAQEVGCDYFFDARQSSADLGVYTYKFDFGDGQSVFNSGGTAYHRYSATGTYDFTLTVADEQGNTATATRTITVSDPSLLGNVVVNVVGENGAGLSGIPVYFDLGTTSGNVKKSGSGGQVAFIAEAGSYDVGAYADGYLPVKKAVIARAGADTQVTLTMVEKPIVTGTFEVNRMTLDEIKAAGIDVYDPANQQVVNVTVHLAYGATPIDVSYQANANGFINPKPVVVKTSKGKRKLLPSISWPDVPIPPDPDDDGEGSGGGGYGEFDIEEGVVAFVDIPVEASYLKEFFDVRLFVINNADREFSIVGNTVDLNVPAGLTLMDNLAGCAPRHVAFGNLAGQEQKTIEWILRGDDAGEYDLEAAYAGTLTQFNAPVKATFKTDEAIKVYGKSAMKIVADINYSIAFDALYFNLSLANKGNADMYLPDINVDGDAITSWQDKRTIRGYEFDESAAAEESASDAGAAAAHDPNLYEEKQVNVTRLGMVYTNAQGLQQTVGSVPDTLVPGSSITKKYVGYGTISYDDVAYLRDALWESANANGAEIVINVVDMDLYSYDDAEDQLGYILGKQLSSYEYIVDSDYVNYYYIGQAAKNGGSILSKVGVVTYGIADLVANLDFSIITGDDKKEYTRKFVSSMLKDESFSQNVDQSVDTKGIKIMKGILGNMSSTLNTKYGDENAAKQIKAIASDSTKLRKLAHDLKNYDTDTLYGRVMTMVEGVTGASAQGVAIHMLYSQSEFAADMGNFVKAECGVMTDSLGKLQNVLGAWNDSAEIRNDLMQIAAAREQATELVDLLCASDDVDKAVLDEVKDIKKQLQKGFKTQDELFASELGKLVGQSVGEAAVKKGTAALIKGFGVSDAGMAGASSVYAALKIVFNGLDYAFGWGDSVDGIKRLQVAGELSYALSQNINKKASDYDTAATSMHALKYLIKMRILGERAYIDTIKEKKEAATLARINERDGTSYSSLESFYNAKCEIILRHRDLLFGSVAHTLDIPDEPTIALDAAGGSATVAAAGLTAGELEYSYDGEVWRDYTDEGINLEPGIVARHVWARVKATSDTAAGNVTKVTIPARPRLTGDFAATFATYGVVVKGLEPGVAYAYAFEGSADDLLTDAPTVTANASGTIVVEAPDGAQAPTVIYVARAATADAFLSFTRAIDVDDVRKDIAAAQVQVTNADELVYGSGTTPEVSVKLDGEEVDKANYYVTYFADAACTQQVAMAQVAAGTYYAKVMGKGAQWYGQQVAEVVVRGIDIASAQIDPLAPQAYTGQPVEPGVSVSLGDKELVQGVDYQVSYLDNVNAGQAVAVVAGMGSCEGEQRIAFQIVPTQLGDDMVVVTGAAVTFDGSAKTPGVTVAFNGKQLAQGEDYTVSYLDNVNAGTASVAVAGVGNFTGTVTKVFDIQKAALSSVAIADIPEQVSDGAAVKPSIVATLGDYQLTARDYAVTYKDNEAAGTATVVLEAREGGNFTGKVEKKFTIKAKPVEVTSLSDVTLTADAANLVYDGKAKTPAITVDGAPLDASQLDVAYVNNVNAGVAKAIVSAKAGAAGYVGSATVVFTIAPAPIDAATVEVPGAPFAYTGSALQPVVNVVLGDTALAQGADYAVAYADNQAVGTGVVTVTGLGNYAGQVQARFAIEGLDANSIDVAFKAETGKFYYKAPGKYYYVGLSVNPRIVAKVNGAELPKGNYTVTYEPVNRDSFADPEEADDIIAVGTYTATVQFKGNYSGTKTLGFQVLPSAIGYIELVDTLPALDTIVPADERVADVIAKAARYFAKMDKTQRKLIPTDTLTKLTEATDAFYAIDDEDAEEVEDALSEEADAPVVTAAGSAISQLNEEAASAGEGYTVALSVNEQQAAGFADYKVDETDFIQVVDVALQIQDQDGNVIEDIDESLANSLCEDLQRMKVTIPVGSQYAGEVARIVHLHEEADGAQEETMYAAKVDQAGNVTVAVDKLSSFIVTIPDAVEKKLDDAQVIVATGSVYNGLEQEPAVTVVSASGTTLVQGKDYEVAYSENVAAGKGTATIAIAAPKTSTYTGSQTVKFDIAPKPITVQADNAAKTVGEADPILTATVEGLVQGDAVNYEVTRITGEDTGRYDIQVEGERIQGNYEVSFAKGLFTINEKTAEQKELEEAEQKARQAMDDVSKAIAVADEAKKLADEMQKKADEAAAAAEAAKSKSPAEALAAAETAQKASADAAEAAADYEQKAAAAKVAADNAASAVTEYASIAGDMLGATLSQTGSIAAALESASQYAERAKEAVSNAGAAVSKAAESVGAASAQKQSAQEAADKAKAAANLANATVTVAGATYTGKALTPAPKVVLGGKTLAAGTDYTVAYKNNVNVGAATVTVTGKGGYTGTKTATFKISKASQAISSKAKIAKTFKGKKLVKSKKLAKKQTIDVRKLAAASAKTAVKYELTVPKKAKKAKGFLKINKSTGKITVKKGLPKGKYVVKVTMSAAGNANYNAARSKTIKLTVTVK